MDSLSITIIFIVISTVVAAFIKGRMRDRCLLDFSGYPVNIELKNGKNVWGILRLEATGLELNYKEPYLDKKDNHLETSFILYKNEYNNIECLARFVEELDDKERKKRDRFLKSISHGVFIGLARRVRNFFATVRDSLIEIANLLMGRMRQIAPVQTMLAGRDKQLSEMQSGVTSYLNMSFEPLLEKHMGRKVILRLSRGDKIVERQGILKGYTSEFLELLDVAYSRSAGERPRKADIIVPRSMGLIRHLSR